MNEPKNSEREPDSGPDRTDTDQPEWGYISTTNVNQQTIPPQTAIPQQPYYAGPPQQAPYPQGPTSPPTYQGFRPEEQYQQQAAAYPGYDPCAVSYSLPKGMSIASLVLGITSIFIAAFITGTLAIILGGIAIGRCNRGEAGGKGMAVAGLILGIIGEILMIIVLSTMGIPEI